MTEKFTLVIAREHAWNYFQLHANQRMAVFNFFVVLTGVLSAGIAGVMQGSAKLALIGIILGPLLPLLSFVFWKLDQRTSFLIKHAEAALLDLERSMPVQSVQLFMTEPQLSQEAKLKTDDWSRQWSYGNSFGLIFISMALIGIISTVLCVLKFVGKISW